MDVTFNTKKVVLALVPKHWTFWMMTRIRVFASYAKELCYEGNYNSLITQLGALGSFGSL